MSNLKISIDALKFQEKVQLKEELPPEFLDISEKDLKITHPVHLKGEAYLSSDYLVIHFAVKTYFQMPCKICNEELSLPLEDENYYSTVSLEDIKTGVYDFSEDIREALLLKLPNFVECNGGVCSERPNVEKFLKKTTSKKLDDNYFPFEKIL